jgi:hypothetical protein
MDSTWKYEFHLDSKWNFFAESPAKLLSISTWNPGGIQVESRWTMWNPDGPCGIQMDHVEHVEFHSLHLLDTDISVDSTWTGGLYTPPNLLTPNL